MKRHAHVLLTASVVALALSGAGCSSCTKTAGTAAAKGDLALMPKETAFVTMANFTRLRGTKLWDKVIELRDQTPDNKARYEDFIKKTGLDPLKQIDSVFVGLPQKADSGEFGAVLRGGPFDEAKLVAYMKEQSQKDGTGDVASSDYNGKKIYTDKSGQAFFAFLDNKTALFAGKEWIKKMIDLSKNVGESAASNDALGGVMKRARTGDGLWGAGLIPEEARARFKGDPMLAPAATMKDAFVAMDFQKGFNLSGGVDLGGEGDAAALTKTVNDQLTEAKKNPQVLMLGMGTFVDAIKVVQAGAAVKIDVVLTQPQVDDLVNRVQGLLKSMGGMMGGGGGMGAPPSMPPGGDVPPMPPPTAPNP